MIAWCLFRLLRLLLPLLLRNAMGNIPCTLCPCSCLFCYCSSSVFEHKEVVRQVVANITIYLSSHHLNPPIHPSQCQLTDTCYSYHTMCFVLFFTLVIAFSFLVLLRHRYLHHHCRRQHLTSVVFLCCFLLLFVLRLLLYPFCAMLI